MILIYKRPTKADFNEAIKGINDWFAKNPKRKVCRAQMFGGLIYKIRRNFVTKDIYSEYLRHTGRKNITKMKTEND